MGEGWLAINRLAVKMSEGHLSDMAQSHKHAAEWKEHPLTLPWTSLPIAGAWLARRPAPGHTAVRHPSQGLSPRASASLTAWPSQFSVQFSSVAQSCPTLQPRGLQHARPPCPSPTPRVYPNSSPLSRWCHPTICAVFIEWTGLILKVLRGPKTETPLTLLAGAF